MYKELEQDLFIESVKLETDKNKDKEIDRLKQDIEILKVHNERMKIYNEILV